MKTDDDNHELQLQTVGELPRIQSAPPVPRSNGMPVTAPAPVILSIQFGSASPITCQIRQSVGRPLKNQLSLADARRAERARDTLGE
jgi:hypothetical protein